MQVLLPLKEFAAAKQRLAGVLSAAERAQLFEAMVEDVLLVLTQHSEIKKIAICSRDQAARWLANYYDVEFIDEKNLSALDLNQAVNQAAKKIHARGECDLLVVHGDLPLLRANDISDFLHVHCNGCSSGDSSGDGAGGGSGNSPAVTMVSDRHGIGTNLLAWRALPSFCAAYGEHSFQRHCAQARALNIEPVVCDLSSARCDIDEPEDLLFLLSQNANSCAEKTLDFLHRSGIAKRLRTMQLDSSVFSSSISNGRGDRERA